MFRFIIAGCLFLNVVGLSKVVFANELAGNEPVCGEIGNTKEFVVCALQNHPLIQESSYDLEIGKGLIKEARRIPNPEIELGVSQTDNIGQTSDTVDLALMMPIEIGGKRGSRINKALAKSELINSEVLKIQELVVLNSLLKIYRLRQVKVELGLIIESLSTFKKVKQQYKNRKSLGPEQAVSLDIFSLAEADYTMRHSALEAEKGELERELSLYIGKKIKPDKNILPKFKSEWPVLSDTAKLAGSDILISRAKRKIAESELEIARSNAWPDLAIGPTYSVETENNDRITTVGVGLQMPLPVFNLNGGNKAVAYAEKRKAEVSQKTQEVNLANRRENLVEIYRSITNRLKKINPESLGEVKHKRIHRYLKRGVVEASLVIESHRQIVEFQEHTNEQELKAVSALWQVRALDGVLLDEVKNINNP
tara:strand:+ start:8271 stop:9542 length:1272 start_codon:yes stop_codon:yes gene_type:complete